MYNHTLNSLRLRELGLVKPGQPVSNKFVQRKKVTRYFEGQRALSNSLKPTLVTFDGFPYLKSKLEINMNRLKYSINYSPADVRRMVQTNDGLKHGGCVNTASWCKTNFFQLATGSDDRTVKLWKLHNENVKHMHTIETGHSSNIFCVEQSPLNKDMFYTCAADGELRVCNVMTKNHTELVASTSDGKMMHMFKFSTHSVHELVTAQADGHSVIYDTRLPAHAKVMDITFETGRCKSYRSLSPGLWPVKCVDIHPINEHIVALAGEAGTYIKIFDRRMFSSSETSNIPVQEYSLESFYNGNAFESDRTFSCPGLNRVPGQQNSIIEDDFSISWLNYNNTGTKMLVNVMGGNIFSLHLDENEGECYDTEECSMKPGGAHWQRRKFKPDFLHGIYFGANNRQTFLKTAYFYGPKDEYVVSGCDSGRAYVWNSKSCNIEVCLEVDDTVCNGVIPHPVFNYLVTYGIDHEAKVWYVSKIKPTHKNKMPRCHSGYCSHLLQPTRSPVDCGHLAPYMENFLLWDRNVDDGLPTCPRQVLIGESELIATKLWKDKGNRNFKNGKLFAAFRCYENALGFLKKIDGRLIEKSNMIARKKREMEQEFKDKWDLIESYFKEDNDFSKEVREFQMLNVSCITNACIVSLKVIEKILSPNFARKTSIEIHPIEVTSTARSIIGMTDDLIKRFDKYSGEEKMRYGRMKISKVYFLRGKANAYLENYEDSVQNFKDSHTYNPKDKSITKELKKVKAKMKRKEKKLASQMKKMFC